MRTLRNLRKRERERKEEKENGGSEEKGEGERGEKEKEGGGGKEKEGSDEWDKLEKFLEETTDLVYVTLDRFQKDLEYVSRMETKGECEESLGYFSYISFLSHNISTHILTHPLTLPPFFSFFPQITSSPSPRSRGKAFCVTSST